MTIVRLLIDILDYYRYIILRAHSVRMRSKNFGYAVVNDAVAQIACRLR